jgi:GTP cyclohydrolase FolE2
VVSQWSLAGLDAGEQDLCISCFQIEVCNEESIHTHDAIARLSYGRPKENPP